MPRAQLAKLIAALSLLGGAGLAIWNLGQAILRAPVLALGDPVSVYLPFARLFAAGRIGEAYATITTLSKMPVYPQLLGLIAWLAGDAESQLLLGVNALCIAASLAIGCVLLRRAGLGAHLGLWLAAVGFHPGLGWIAGTCVPDALLTLLSLIFIGLILGQAPPKWAGVLAGLAYLTRPNPFALPLAFQLLDGRPSRARVGYYLRFYGPYLLTVGAVCAAVLLLVWTRYQLPFPILFSLSGEDASGAAEGSLALVLLRRVAIERPIELLGMIVPAWLALPALAGLVSIARTSGEQRRLVLALAATPISLFAVHYEPRYLVLWIYCYATLALIGLEVLARRLALDPVWVALASLLLTFAVAFGLQPAAAAEWASQTSRREAVARSRNDCAEIAAVLPSGAVLRMDKASFGFMYSCLFDRVPADGFVDDGEALGARFIEREPKDGCERLPAPLCARIVWGPGRVHPLLPAAREISQAAGTTTASAALEFLAISNELEGSALPFELRAPAWRRQYGRWQGVLQKSATRLRVRTADASIPLELQLWLSVQGQNRSLGHWWLAANERQHELLIDAPAGATFHLLARPMRKRWPAGRVLIESIELGR